MDPGDWIGLGSLVLAAIVGVAHLSLQSRVTRIERERRRDEIEERRRAQLVAAFGHRVKHGRNQPVLEIANNGPATARNVSFDPAALAGRVQIGEDELPISKLDPRRTYTFDWAIDLSGGPQQFDLEVSWNDDTGPRSDTFVIHAVRR